MNNIDGKYLPIGTVVMLKGASKRLMITGFCTMPADKKDEMYDYSGCLYPEGFLSSDQTALFNHDQIEKIYHVGLSDEEDKKFKQTLEVILNNTAKKDIKPSNSNQPSTSSVPTLEMPIYNNNTTNNF